MKIVYIDVQNTHVSIKKSGWEVDWQKFYTFLRDKYSIDVVYYVAGYIPQNIKLYQEIQTIGYTMLFKKTVVLPDGTIKGNVDIDIAIRVMLEMKDRVVDSVYLVTNDGDYNTLIETCMRYKVWKGLFTPHRYIASRLLKHMPISIVDMQDIKSKIQKLPST